MATLRSRTYVPPLTVNEVALGQPVILTLDNGTLRPQQPGDNITDLYFAWDDSALPQGELLPDGTIIPDEVTP